MAKQDKRGIGEDVVITNMPELMPAEIFLSKQLEAAKRDRRRWEGEWQSSEASLFDIGSEGGALRGDNQISQIAATGEEPDIGSYGDTSDNFMGVNISARNMQLIFSQLCSNIPVVMAVPQSNEQSDINAAKGAEVTTSYMRKQYGIDNRIALGSYNTYVYGTGFIKQIFDGSKGAMAVINGAVKNLGDHVFSTPSPWDMYIDPNAKSIDTISWLTERLFVNLEDAVIYFGEDLREILLTYKVDFNAAPSQGSYSGNVSLFYDIRFDCVEIFERWETGTPANNYKGSLTYHLRDGRILKKGDNPCKHPMYPDSRAKSTMCARLPYTLITYEDIPNSIWGRTPAAKCSRAQNMLNACYMVMLQTAQNMGTPHLVVNKSSLGDSAQSPVTNNSINIIPLDLSGEAGGTMPFTLQAAAVSPDVRELIINLTNYINEAWGVNDALLGKQQRETQGITMQLSVMQGNMIRERFFNKYIYAVEDIYTLALADAAANWSQQKFLKVLGMDNKVSADALVGSDIASGYVLKIERSNMFALDPITRQEQIIALAPYFKDAGMDPRTTLRQLRLADLRGAYDEFDKADNRAQKILERIKEGEKIRISKYEDHIGITGFMQKYVMTEEFDELDEEIKVAIEAHIDERLKSEGSNRLPATPPAPPPPQAAPGPDMGMPPMPPQIGPM
jgi:hypothetical protein